jgi:hypothetical protein
MLTAGGTPCEYTDGHYALFGTVRATQGGHYVASQGVVSSRRVHCAQ